MSDLAFSLAPACHALLDFDAALTLMARTAGPVAIETVPLAQAATRVLAEPVLAARDAPPVDVAAMDGYAIGEAGADAFLFRVVGEAFPGTPCALAPGAGEAVRIFTGAPMPAGTDRVIVQEDVARHGDMAVSAALPGAGRHVRQRGSDFECGDRLLPAGRVLDPRALVAAAASGAGRVRVWRRPRVTIIASGDELSRPGDATGRSIPDSVSLAVVALAEAWGAVVVATTIVADRLDLVERCLGDAMAASDVVVIIGGASTGDRDHSRTAAASLGVAQTFAKVAMKPGKPVWYGTAPGVHVLGLPGNPTAALTTARLFLVPLLCLLTGRPTAAGLRWRTAPLGEAVAAGGDRETFLCGDWDGEQVRLIAKQSASAQARLADANVLVRATADAPARTVGALVSILDF